MRLHWSELMLVQHSGLTLEWWDSFEQPAMLVPIREKIDIDIKPSTANKEWNESQRQSASAFIKNNRPSGGIYRLLDQRLIKTITRTYVLLGILRETYARIRSFNLDVDYSPLQFSVADWSSIVRDQIEMLNNTDSRKVAQVWPSRNRVNRDVRPVVVQTRVYEINEITCSSDIKVSKKLSGADLITNVTNSSQTPTSALYVLLEDMVLQQEYDPLN